MRTIAPMHPDAIRVGQILGALDAAGPPPTTVAGMRDFARRRAARMQADAPHVARVVNETAPNGAHNVPVRIYYPEAAGGKPVPAYVYAHGGGFVVGDLEMVETMCRTLCRDVGIAVISVDYRLAPEHKFPAGLDDTRCVVEWAVKNAASLGIDPKRLAIGGDSAGGNLAAATAMSLQAGSNITLRYQVLAYPVTDLTCAEPSYRDLGSGYPLTADRMKTYIAHYLNDPAEARDPRASPLFASSLAGQPPALVILAGLDPLVDEGRAYADRLRDAGVDVEIIDVPDHPHGFLGWTREAKAARACVALIARRLGEHLRG